MCEIRVPQYPYVAVGNSTNKKDAERNAARDFVNFLVRTGKIQPNEIPADAGIAAVPSNNDFPDNSDNQRRVFDGNAGPQDLGQAYRPMDRSCKVREIYKL